MFPHGGSVTTGVEHDPTAQISVGSGDGRSRTVSAVSASAAIVCSGRVCWHTHERYEYPRHLGLLSMRITGSGADRAFTGGASMRAAATGVEPLDCLVML
jgi:hypothetical protein